MAREPTVFVVDDNPGVRQSLAALGDSAGLRVETYESIKAFLAAYDPARPGCLLLDVRLKGSDGLDLQDELRRLNASLPIIVMTAYGNVRTSVRAFKGGAIDFLQKPVAPEELLKRIREAIQIDRERREDDAERVRVGAHLKRLTRREHEVMDLLMRGMTSKEIAFQLALSVRTVEGHRRQVLRKMRVGSAAQLVAAVLGARARNG